MYINAKDIKQHADDVLNRKLKKLNENKMPNVNNIGFNTFNKSWATAVAIDIRGFKKMVDSLDNEKIVHIIQSFTSSIIKIAKKSENFITCYINGDEVISVFETNKSEKISDTIDVAAYMSSFANYQFPKLLEQKNIFSGFKAGIGVWTSDDNTLINYGEKGSSGETFNTVLGSTINWSSFLAKKANKETNSKILYNGTAAINFIGKEKELHEKYGKLFNNDINGSKVFGYSVRYGKFAE